MTVDVVYEDEGRSVIGAAPNTRRAKSPFQSIGTAGTAATGPQPSQGTLVAAGGGFNLIGGQTSIDAAYQNSSSTTGAAPHIRATVIVPRPSQRAEANRARSIGALESAHRSLQSLWTASPLQPARVPGAAQGNDMTYIPSSSSLSHLRRVVKPSLRSQGDTEGSVTPEQITPRGSLAPTTPVQTPGPAHPPQDSSVPTQYSAQDRWHGNQEPAGGQDAGLASGHDPAPTNPRASRFARRLGGIRPYRPPFGPPIEQSDVSKGA